MGFTAWRRLRRLA